jgi:hypothetical protein
LNDVSASARAATIVKWRPARARRPWACLNEVPFSAHHGGASCDATYRAWPCGLIRVPE